MADGANYTNSSCTSSDSSLRPANLFCSLRDDFTKIKISINNSFVANETG